MHFHWSLSFLSSFFSLNVIHFPPFCIGMPLIYWLMLVVNCSSLNDTIVMNWCVMYGKYQTNHSFRANHRRAAETDALAMWARVSSARSCSYPHVLLCLLVYSSNLRYFISPFLSTSFLDFSSSRLCFLLPIYLFILPLFPYFPFLPSYLCFFSSVTSFLFPYFPFIRMLPLLFIFLTSWQSSYLQNTSSSSKFVLLLRIYALETFDLLF